MNGYLEGRLTDAEGCEMLLASAKETARVGKRLGVQRLNLHGTGLGDGGVPIPHIGAFAPGMEQRARTRCTGSAIWPRPRGRSSRWKT